MNIILFGASGMIGQGVLRECLLDPSVDRVLAVVRKPLDIQHPKLSELQVDSFQEYSKVEHQLSGFDVCLYCLGVSALGLSEADYRRITFDFTLSAAVTLAWLNPDLRFLYISGANTDSTGEGRIMWARVKGQTENALLTLPFKAHMLRPGFIQPLHGIHSKTPMYRRIYALVAPFTPLLRRLMPNHMLTTEELGKAMLRIAREGHSKNHLEVRDLRQLVAG